MKYTMIIMSVLSIGMSMQAADSGYPLWVKCVGIGCGVVASGALSGYCAAKYATKESPADAKLAAERVRLEVEKSVEIERLHAEFLSQQQAIYALQRQVAALHQVTQPQLKAFRGGISGLSRSPGVLNDAGWNSSDEEGGTLENPGRSLPVQRDSLPSVIATVGCDIGAGVGPSGVIVALQAAAAKDTGPHRQSVSHVPQSIHDATASGSFSSVDTVQ